MFDLYKLREEIIRHRLSDQYLQEKYNNDIQKVINPEYDIYEHLHLMPDIDKGVEILKRNMDNNVTIIGCVDLDQDGLGSGVVIKRILTDLFKYPSEKILILPNKRSKGRGFTYFLKNIIKNYKQKDSSTNLVILADHGIGDEARYKELKQETGMDIILTDHHEVNYNNYPASCDAVINVHRKECEFDRSICGCCTVFLFLVYAYWKIKGVKDIHAFKHVLPFVALTTIVDSMPLHTPINRYLIKLGFHYMNTIDDILWKSLASSLRIGNEIMYQHAGGKIGPLFNAGNRMDVELLAYKLLASNTKEEYNKHYEQMDHVNKLRKVMKQEIVDKCLSELKDKEIGSSIVLHLDTDIAIGGVVAGSIGSMYSRPVICLNAIKEGDLNYNGSARCPYDEIRFKDIIEEISKENPGMIPNLGGHANAFGVAIARERIDEFKLILEDKVAKALAGVDFDKDIEHEFELDPSFIDIHLAQAVYDCAPYGVEFPEPIFLIKDLIVEDIYTISSFVKMRFLTPNLGTLLHTVWFFKGRTKMGINVNNIKSKIRINDIVDVYCSIERANNQFGYDIMLHDVIVKGST